MDLKRCDEKGIMFITKSQSKSKYGMYMKKTIFYCLILVGTLSASHPSCATIVPREIEVLETSEFGIDPALISQAYPNPIVAEKPSFIQRQLMRVGLPVYFALRAGKNYMVHIWHTIRS